MLCVLLVIRLSFFRLGFHLLQVEIVLCLFFFSLYRPLFKVPDFLQIYICLRYLLSDLRCHVYLYLLYYFFYLAPRLVLVGILCSTPQQQKQICAESEHTGSGPQVQIVVVWRIIIRIAFPLS